MRRFLKQFLRRFTGSVSANNLPDIVQSDEPLTRFVFASSLFAVSTGRVKPQAFLPGKDMETSVYRIAKLADAEIWGMGKVIRKEPLKARADIT